MQVVTPKALRVRAVATMTGLSRGSIYRLQAAGEFPHCIKIGKQASAWLESEVTQWLADRIAASRSVPAKA